MAGYGGDTALRLGFYRRIAAAEDLEQLAAIQAEVIDRCGALPAEAALLFDVGRLRILGQQQGIARFSLETGGVIQLGLLDEQKSVRFLRSKLGNSLRLPREALAVIAEPADPPTPRQALKDLLRRLQA